MMMMNLQFVGKTALVRVDPKPKPRAKPRASASAKAHVAAPPEPIVDAVAPAPKASSSSSSSSSYSSTSDNDSSDSFAIGGKRSAGKEWIELSSVDDQPLVKLDEYTPKAQKEYKRLILKCQHHPSCFKKRNVTHTKTHGRREPLAFLVAWHRMGGDLAKAAHCSRKLKVPRDAVQNAMHHIGSSCDPVLDKFGL